MWYGGAKHAALPAVGVAAAIGSIDVGVASRSTALTVTPPALRPVRQDRLERPQGETGER